MPNKQFKILGKEPYKFTSKAGQVYDKCKYKTDSDVLDIFAMNLEIGQSYDFEEQEKTFNGRVYKNWVLARPKNSLELRLDSLESRVANLEGKSIEIDKVNAELAGQDPDEEQVDLKDIPF